MASVVDVEQQNKKTWGGARRGAGRPRGRWRSDPPHRRREELSSRHPVHVVFRAIRPFLDLRQRRLYHVTRRVLDRYLGLEDFRVVHVSIQDSHFHLIVEASDRAALSRRLQSLEIRLARALNRELGRIGKVFAFRYHATQITTPRQARNTLAYVLNNWRKHGLDYVNRRLVPGLLDSYASGLAFDGWDHPVPFRTPAGYLPLPVSPPRTLLLRSDWRRFGLISPHELPSARG